MIQITFGFVKFGTCIYACCTTPRVDDTEEMKACLMRAGLQADISIGTNTVHHQGSRHITYDVRRLLQVNQFTFLVYKICLVQGSTQCQTQCHSTHTVSNTVLSLNGSIGPCRPALSSAPSFSELLSMQSTSHYDIRVCSTRHDWFPCTAQLGRHQYEHQRRQALALQLVVSHC